MLSNCPVLLAGTITAMCQGTTLEEEGWKNVTTRDLVTTQDLAPLALALDLALGYDSVSDKA